MNWKLAQLSSLVALLSLACFPAGVSDVGKLCSAERPCGSGSVCTQGVCVGSPVSPSTGKLPDGGSVPPNLAVNGDFESGITVGWQNNMNDGMKVVAGQGRNGSYGLEIFATGDVQVSPTSPPVQQAIAGSVYCARAYLLGKGEAQLAMIGGVGPQGFTMGPIVVFNPQTWVAATAKHTMTSNSSMTFQIDVSFGGSPSPFYVDDIELWQSTDGNCDER